MQVCHTIALGVAASQEHMLRSPGGGVIIVVVAQGWQDGGEVDVIVVDGVGGTGAGVPGKCEGDSESVVGGLEVVTREVQHKGEVL